MKIIIIGGGIAGLSAAWELSGRADVTLLEASARCGGKLTTATLETPFGISVVDGSAESFVTRKEAAYQLLLELGLQDQILEPEADTSGVYLLRDRTIQPVPTSPLALLRSKLLSWRGKLRLLREPLTRASAPSRDESLHDFLERRVGVEAAEIFGPVMAGIYSADPRRTSALASFSVLRELERDHGSLMRGMLRRRPKRGARRLPRAVTLRGGVETLVNALEMQVRTRGVAIQTNAAVERVQSGVVTLRDGSRLSADAVILALPAPSAAKLLERSAPACATALQALPHTGIGTLALVYPASALERLSHLRGVMIPRSEGREIDAVLFTGFKMPERTPRGTGLLRVFFGANSPELIRATDEALLAVVSRELRELFGIDAAPLNHSISRWHDFPILELGHLERVAKAEVLLPRGVLLAGASYRGIGVPDCVRQGRESARRALELSAQPTPKQPSPQQPGLEQPGLERVA